MNKKVIAVLIAFVASFAVMLTVAPATSAAPAPAVAAVAPALPTYSPCQGYCVNIQNMDWTLNHSVQIGICDGCGPYNWSWLLNVNQQTPSVTPDVDGYYIGAGWCAKEFRSYGNNVWTEGPNGPKVGPVKVTTWDFSWYRVYAYQAQAPYGCNF